MTDINCEVSIFEYFQKNDTPDASWKNLLTRINSLQDDFNDEFDKRYGHLKNTLDNTVGFIAVRMNNNEILDENKIESDIDEKMKDLDDFYKSLPFELEFNGRYSTFIKELMKNIEEMNGNIEAFNRLESEIQKKEDDLEALRSDQESIQGNSAISDLLKEVDKLRKNIDNIKTTNQSIEIKINDLKNKKQQLESKIKELNEKDFREVEGVIDTLKKDIIKDNVNLLQHHSLLEMYNIKQNHHKKLKDAYNNKNEIIIKKINETIKEENNKLQSQEKELQSLEKQLTEFIEKETFDEKAFRKEFLEEYYNNKSVKTPKKSPGFGYKDDDGLGEDYEVGVKDLYGDNEGFKKMGEIFSSANYIRKKETTDFSKIEEFNNQLNVNIQGMNAALNNLK
jgi:DNA repair exonuclease SbcCD ATPase subunit